MEAQRNEVNSSHEIEVAATLSEYAQHVRNIFEKGGPDISDYNFLTAVPLAAQDIDLEEQAKIYEFLSPLLGSLDCMVGFAFQKPHGYAGDFEVINRIYDERISENKDLSKWDEYYHQLDAPMAVRNRKTYFKKLIDKTADRKEDALVLNIGSGPCADLHEYLVKTEDNQIMFECLDMDKNAIEYGTKVCSNYLDNVSFINKNAFRFKPDYQYDLIWSAGMFDYFSDKLFVRLVNRMYGLVKDGGELVIGNFSTYNPSRDVMEVFTQWYLHHRDEKTLTNLALDAGIESKNISVEREETGVNLFLHLRK